MAAGATGGRKSRREGVGFLLRSKWHIEAYAQPLATLYGEGVQDCPCPYLVDTIRSLLPPPINACSLFTNADRTLSPRLTYLHAILHDMQRPCTGRQTHTLSRRIGSVVCQHTLELQMHPESIKSKQRKKKSPPTSLSLNQSAKPKLQTGYWRDYTHLAHLSFWSALSCLRNPLLYLLSKVINQKCQTRRFAETCFARLRRFPTLRRELKMLVLCSLLGNYEHCEAGSRPKPHVRSFLYMFLFDNQAEPACEQFFDEIVAWAPFVVVFALRDYLLYAIPDEPALLAHVNSLMQFPLFATHVNAANNRIRTYFDTQLSERFSSLRKGWTRCQRNLLYVPFQVSDVLRTSTSTYGDVWGCHLQNLLKPQHNELLRIGYQRCSISFVQLVRCARKSVPLLVLFPEHMHDSITPTFRCDMDTPESVDGNEGDDDDANSTCNHTETLLRWEPYISSTHMDELRRITTNSNGSLLACLPSLRPLDWDAETVLLVEMWILSHEVRRVNPRVVRGALSTFASRFPVQYNMLQVLSELLRDASRVRYTETLPEHIFRAQVRALQERWGLEQTQWVVDTSTTFTYCPVCFAFYSLVRDFRTVIEQGYPFGYRDVLVHPDTLAMSCNRSCTTYRGTCGITPLRNVLLLGKVLQFERRLLMLCPQYKCGKVMVFQGQFTAFNERGPSCSECTKRIRAESERVWLQKHAPAPTICAYCGQTLSKNLRNAYVYPRGVALCDRHHRTVGLAAAFEEQDELYAPWQNAAQVAQALYTLIIRLRKDSRQRRLPYYKNQLASFKRNAAAAKLRR